MHIILLSYKPTDRNKKILLPTRVSNFTNVADIDFIKTLVVEITKLGTILYLLTLSGNPFIIRYRLHQWNLKLSHRDLNLLVESIIQLLGGYLIQAAHQHLPTIKKSNELYYETFWENDL